jgi:hypothetical protein
LKKLLIATGLLISIAVSAIAQTATVEVIWYPDSSVNVNVHWNDITLHYGETNHRFYSHSDDESIDSSQVSAKIKNNYAVVMIETFTVDISSVVTPNGVMRTVNKTYADMRGKENLILLMPDVAQLSPDLTYRNNKKSGETSLFFKNEKATWYIQKTGFMSKAVVESITYYGLGFDSIPMDIQLKPVTLKQSNIFDALESPSTFKYYEYGEKAFAIYRANYFTSYHYKNREWYKEPLANK